MRGLLHRKIHDIDVCGIPYRDRLYKFCKVLGIKLDFCNPHLHEYDEVVHKGRKIKIAKLIFGNTIFVGAEGTYQEVNDQDIWGIYTSTTGRVYNEWKQTSHNEYGNLTIKTWDNYMWKVGCGLYSATMLLNSIGIDATPEDFMNAFDSKGGNFVEATKLIIAEKNKKNEVDQLWNEKDFIEKLNKGYGCMTYVNGKSEFTSNMHWIVLADIRDSQLGSSKGYDVFVLTSSRSGRGWHPIEDVTNYLMNSSYFGIYIGD